MSRFGRATGIAVAGISLAVGAILAAPSRAEEAAGVAAAPYTAHAVAAPVLNAVVDAAGTDQNIIAGLPRAGAGGTLPAPVASHALAPLDAGPVAVEDGDSHPIRSLSELVGDYASSEIADGELECLATAVYFESKGEPLAGQLAVAEVIINRTRSGRFPETLCGVVKQRGQFSFVRAGQMPAVPRGSVHWRTAVAIAQIAHQQLSSHAATPALYFHARRVAPGWHLTRVGAVGNHVFYR